MHHLHVQLLVHVVLKYVPKNYKTYELCFEAVNNEGKALEYTPDEFKTFEGMIMKSYIPIERVRALQESVGWLKTYS